MNGNKPVNSKEIPLSMKRLLKKWSFKKTEDFRVYLNVSLDRKRALEAILRARFFDYSLSFYFSGASVYR
jgi:hypothetical protein